jgi:Ca-activated chloride channel family protein
MPVQIDEGLLRDVSQSTGGRYFRATDAEALTRIFQQIDQLEKTPVEITRYERFEERVRPWILLGLVALVAELALGATLVVRVT